MNTVVVEHSLPTSQTIQIARGDLTAETTDAIVNAANSHLQHGAGVAGAIVHGGGYVIQQESNAWVAAHGPVTHDKPAWTSAGKLAARYVIHAVGPMWGEGSEDTKLARAIRGSLRVGDELKLTSISFPAISTGIFGFPKERAADILLKTVSSYFASTSSGLQVVRFVLFDQETERAFLAAWQNMGWAKP